MTDRMLELFTHKQVAEFVLNEIAVPEEYYADFDAHLDSCPICGPVYRSHFGCQGDECSRDTLEQFMDMLEVDEKKQE